MKTNNSDDDKMGWNVQGEPNSPLGWILLSLLIVVILAMYYSPGPLLTGEKIQPQPISQNCQNNCGRQ